MSTNGTSLVNDVAPGPALPAKKASSRVAQLGAKIKSVATATGEKSKLNLNAQKRPAPVLPQEAKKGSERAQELNKYAASKARGEATSFLDLVRSLGELRAVGEKGHRQLLTAVLPRLAQHELPPASIVPQLIQLAAASDDRRLVRFVYYLLQLVLGSGSAGTPSPASGESAQAVVSLPADISSRAWQDAEKPETVSALAELQLRTLSAAARAIDGGRLDKQLVAAINNLLDRAEAGVGAGQPKSKADKRLRSEAWDLHWSALIAARNALQGKAANKIALRSSVGIVSPQASGARQAVALLTHSMRQNAAGVFKEDKDLAGLMAATASVYESSAYVLGAERKTAADSRRVINISDQWARVEVARLCSAAVYADWTSTSDFVKRVGAPFWKMLCLLATRDKEGLVRLEATRCLFGGVPGTRTGPAEEARNVKLRVRAWLLVTSYAERPIGYEKGDAFEADDSLAVTLGAGVKQALAGGNSEPLRCSACRTAGAILEAATRAAGRGGRGAADSTELQKMVYQVMRAVKGLAESSPSPAIRCAAIEALLWSQAGSKETVVSPSGLSRHIANSQWSPDLLEALLERVYQTLRAVPAAAPQLLQIAGAVASAAASSIKADQLLELWSMAMKMPNGKSAALSAALGMLGNSTSPNPPPPKGASAKALARAAANEAGWLEVLRNTAWWLGENANLACNEFAGSLPPPELHNENEAPEDSPTPLETTALEAFRNPPLAAVISHLQHAALTMPPAPRTAAVQALTKVAVRSEEPYRLHCYSFLASLDTASQSSEPDTHGVACVVQPVLPILDMLYSTRLVLDSLATQYGRIPQRWPPSVVLQLRERNTLLEQRIQRTICSLSAASYFVLGPLSRDLLTSGVENLAPQPSLQRGGLANLKTAMSMTSSQDTMQSPLPSGALHSRNNSMRSEAGGTGTPLFGGADPLAALTENLNQHITSEAFRPRAPAPWELNTFDPPTTIPEEETFGFADREASHSRRVSREDSQQIAEDVQYLRERGVAVHTFEAEMSDELTVRNGEEVDVEAEVDGWLHCVNRYGIRGLVPASYVRILGANEGPADVASQLFGGYGASMHQREKSVDLLNQPDMLAALLGPSQTEDDWGSPTAQYHTHTRDASMRDGEFELPAMVSDNLEGDMAIPEPTPYTEPEPYFEEDYEEPESSHEEELHGQSSHPIKSQTEVSAPDNPFDDEPAPDNPFGENPARQQSNPFEPADVAYEPTSFQPASVDYEPAPPVAYESAAPQTVPPPVPYESTLNPAVSDSLPEVQYEATSSLRPNPARPGAPTPGMQIATASLQTAPSEGQPLSARVEHEVASSPSSSRRASDFTTFGGSGAFAADSGEGATAQPGHYRQDPQPGSSRAPVSRRHSRTFSREFSEGHARTLSTQLSRQASHVRGASQDSVGRRASFSRQESVEVPFLSLQGNVAFAFDAEADDELTVAPGDGVVIQAEIDGWYQVTRVSDGRRGLVPASYVNVTQ